MKFEINGVGALFTAAGCYCAFAGFAAPSDLLIVAAGAFLTAACVAQGLYKLHLRAKENNELIVKQNEGLAKLYQHTETIAKVKVAEHRRNAAS